MTGTVTYGVDCASFQGDPDWVKVSATCRFGAEKVTEGAGQTAYVNPRWAKAKPAMLTVARHGFVPLAYMFLDAVEAGGAQAAWFAKNAGDLTGFGIAVDFERAPNGVPTRAQAVAAVTELRKLYPHHPIGAYAPHWFTVSIDLTFADWLWASEYVIGSGDPAMLYSRVPAAWWAPYGGETPLLLQFTDAASVAGISGAVDCSAYHGSEQQLAGQVLPAAASPLPPPPPPPPTTHGGDDMLIQVIPGEPPVSFPVWANAKAYGEPGAYGNCSLRLTGGSGAVVKATLFPPSGAPEVFTRTMHEGSAQTIVPAHGWDHVEAVEVQRLDTKKAVGASAVFRTW